MNFITIEYIKKNAKGFSLTDITESNLTWKYQVDLKGELIPLSFSLGKDKKLIVNLGSKTIKYIPKKVVKRSELGSIIIFREFLQKLLEKEGWREKNSSIIQDEITLERETEFRWNKIEVKILCGLPGSGKTSYIKILQKKHRKVGDKYTSYIYIDLEKKVVSGDFDIYKSERFRGKDLSIGSIELTQLLDLIQDTTYSYKKVVVYIDGGIFVNDISRKALLKYFSWKVNSFGFLVFLAADLNISKTRELCLANIERRVLELEEKYKPQELELELESLFKPSSIPIPREGDEEIEWAKRSLSSLRYTIFQSTTLLKYLGNPGTKNSHIIIKEVTEEERKIRNKLELELGEKYIYTSSYRSSWGNNRGIYWNLENYEELEEEELERNRRGAISMALSGLRDINIDIVSLAMEYSEEIDDINSLDPYWDGEYSIQKINIEKLIEAILINNTD